VYLCGNSLEPTRPLISRGVVSLERCWHSFGFCAVLAVLLGACSTFPKGSRWGADATISPGWERVTRAAVTAVKDPFTWAPAVGAAALQIDDLDDEIADWANDETPVFGSRESASDASNWLRAASVAAYVGTGLAAPTPSGDWLRMKAKGFAVGASAIAATIGTTTLLKEATDRDRPLGQDDDSFPSGHASLASVSGRLTHETLRYYDLPWEARIATDAGLASVALATGWARVEAGKHHPADVLAGAALGNFIAVFATEAFLHPALGQSVSLHAVPARDGMGIQLSLAF
jgi:membrane-associated phospholipid phosphatase